MEVRLGYKQTEVGVIPEDWEARQLYRIADMATGNTPPTNDQSNYGNEYLFVSPVDLGKGKWILDSEKKLSPKGYALAKIFPVNSILYTCIGSTIGKAGIAPVELTSNQQINAVLPNSDYCSDFLYYALRLLTPRIKSLAGEQAVPIINKTTFGETSIPLPPTKAEQEAIAEALSDADALIQSLEKLIAKKQLIKQGVMQELLTPKEGWATRKLGEVLRVRHGKSQKEVADEGGLYPILASGGILGRANEYLCNKPSVLIGRKGTIDKPQYMETPFWSVDTLFYTEIFEDYDAKFLFYMFLLIDWYSYNEASGVPSLNAATIQMIERPFPKTYVEQTRISGILSDMDTEISSLETKLAKYKNIKQGMMQELLTGKIRLVKVVN